MKDEMKGDKISRVLQIYSKLSDGYVVNKARRCLAQASILKNSYEYSSGISVRGR